MELSKHEIRRQAIQGSCLVTQSTCHPVCTFHNGPFSYWLSAPQIGCSEARKEQKFKGLSSSLINCPNKLQVKMCPDSGEWWPAGVVSGYLNRWSLLLKDFSALQWRVLCGSPHDPHMFTRICSQPWPLTPFLPKLLRTLALWAPCPCPFISVNAERQHTPSWHKDQNTPNSGTAKQNMQAQRPNSMCHSNWLRPRDHTNQS
jgi:hypothetical protein